MIKLGPLKERREVARWKRRRRQSDRQLEKVFKGSPGFERRGSNRRRDVQERMGWFE